MPAAAVDKRQRIMQIREVMTVLFLAVMGWKDWKKKEISLLLTGTYGIIGLAFSIYAERPLEDWLLPFGVSLMILAVSVLTGGEIGMGDGWIFSGTRNNAAYRNVCKNGMYRNVDRSGVCGSPSGYMQKRTQDRNSTGAFLTVWISGRIIAMKARKGSFTIEAACVMSLVLITVMGVLYLSFFVHNRSWLTAAAYEAALAGSIEGVQKNGQIYEAASDKSTGTWKCGILWRRESVLPGQRWKNSKSLLSGRYNRWVWRFSLGTADGGQFKDHSSGAVDPQSKSSI